MGFVEKRAKINWIINSHFFLLFLG